MPLDKPILVGVTGGIGSGKTTVCRIFETLGIPTYDADSQAKKLMLEDVSLKARIVAQFGNEAYMEDGTMNRAHLAKTVFSNTDKLSKLNALVHPAVAKDFENWVSLQDSKYVIKEAALLIESGSYKHLDQLINVNAPIDLRIKRVKQRDTFRSENEIRKIINNQLSEEERNNKADYVITNDESDFLIKQVLELHEMFIN